MTPWVKTDNTEKHYAEGESALRGGLSGALIPALRKLDNEGFDFSRFDLDNDGRIDAIIVLHSGYAAELGGSDCYMGGHSRDRIWSHAIAYTDRFWKSNRQDITVGGYSIASAMRGTCHARPARIAVITHEFMHILGLPDLNDGHPLDYVGKGIGEYDIMSNAHGVDGSQIYPAHLSPWCKYKMGWVDPIEIGADGVFTIRPSAHYPDIYIIREGFKRYEYMLIENRQSGEMWDKNLPGSGLLIYHIDDTSDMKIRGYPGKKGFPGDGKHYRVSVVQADRNYDLERGANSGDAGDYWAPGSGSLGPGPTEKEATEAGVYPNTNTYRYVTNAAK